jgi:SAM-dependent methyltransferase
VHLPLRAGRWLRGVLSRDATGLSTIPSDIAANGSGAVGVVGATRRRLDPPFNHFGGFAWSQEIPDLRAISDPGEDGRPRSPVLVLEDGVQLLQPHALHDHIRANGGGRFSHWRNDIVLSASDNSDPNANGRLYELLIPAAYKDGRAEGGPLSEHIPQYPFEEAVDYAIQLARSYLSLFENKGLAIEGRRILELGPGLDFAPQLVLASHGAHVTLADPYLPAWNGDYHPRFYRAFLERWDGRGDAVRSVLDHGGYEHTLELVRESAEQLSSIPSSTFDYVQSNAVLEHVFDMNRAAAELARVTKPNGIHAHQVDFRDHRDFSRPLDHLLLDSAAFYIMRKGENATNGTALRMPEMIEIFSRFFWLWDIEANMRAPMDYVAEIRKNLPPTSPYRDWPAQLLCETSGRLWLVRKSGEPQV